MGGGGGGRKGRGRREADRLTAGNIRAVKEEREAQELHQLAWNVILERVNREK